MINHEPQKSKKINYGKIVCKKSITENKIQSKINYGQKNNHDLIMTDVANYKQRAVH